MRVRSVERLLLLDELSTREMGYLRWTWSGLSVIYLSAGLMETLSSGFNPAERPQVMNGTASAADWSGCAKRFGHIVFGILCGGERGAVSDETAYDSTRECAASAVRGGCGNVLSWQPMLVAASGEEQVVGRIEMAGGGEDGQLWIALLEEAGCESYLLAIAYRLARQDAQFVEVWGDPVDERQQARAHDPNTFRRQQFPA